MATAGTGYIKESSDWGPRSPANTLKKLHEALQDYDDCIGMTSDRLYDAYLQIHQLTAADFPEPLRPRFQALLEAMTFRHDTTSSEKQGWIGNARNTLKGMSPEDCEMIIYLLSDLIGELEKTMARQSFAPTQGQSSAA